jgi:hypothetical protein
MELTEDDFKAWLTNPVTEKVRAMMVERQNQMALELADRMVDGGVVTLEEQFSVHGKSAAYREIHELSLEDMQEEHHGEHDGDTPD